MSITRAELIDQGLKLRDEILELQRQKSPELTQRVRDYCRHLCHRNIGLAVYGIPHVFTTDDLRDRLPLQVLDNIGDNRFFGAVVGQRDQFVPVAWKITRMAGNHGRQIRLFTIPDYLDVVRDFQRRNPGCFNP